jgi:hypothetical protein
MKPKAIFIGVLLSLIVIFSNHAQEEEKGEIR